MSQIFFISLLIFTLILRIPLAFIVVILRPLIKFFRERLEFERQNIIDEASLVHFKAHYCFEISSEGELEQVRPLIQKALDENKSIEIIYSSPSVDKKIHKLYEDYKGLVRLYRMPLLSGFPFPFLYFQSVLFWVSAPVVIFCRYDFFPELLLLKLMGKKFVLVSGAFKKTSWYKLESFKLFDVVIAATESEKKNFATLPGFKGKVYSCDFRIPRIAQRYASASITLAKHTNLVSYLDYLKKLPFDKKIILGSAWPSDLAIFNDEKFVSDIKSGNIHVLIAPHKLGHDFVIELKNKLAALLGQANVEVITGESSYQKAPVIILQMSGILCELYSFFKFTYVGGGYERSIHSVLEPYFSGNAVAMGPKIARSTEYDLAKETTPNEIHVLNNPESFYNIFKSCDLNSLDQNARSRVKLASEAEMAKIFSEIIN